MSSGLSTRPYKGTRDFYPDDQRIQNWMFGKFRDVVSRYGYQEYNGPMLESFDLYAAKTGEEIVEKQLYHFLDRGERKIAIRPEMTPTMARMVAGKINELPKPVRWFSLPNLWRYERPQRGRLREHWQLNVDVLGGEMLLADTEILCVALDLISEVGGEDKVKAHLNSRRLVDWVMTKKLELNAETALSATKAMDARAKIGEEAYAEWLKKAGVDSKQRKGLEQFFSSDFETVLKQFDCDGARELAKLIEGLAKLGFSDRVSFDPMILRGMDYYTGTVFELYDISPENNRAMFGGGRYDNLVGMFGKKALSGVGFGMGDVTFRDFLETHSLLPELKSGVDVFVQLPDLDLRVQVDQVASELREKKWSVATALQPGGFGDQLKVATKLGARFAILMGEEELKEKKVVIKHLESRKQETVSIDGIDGFLRSFS